MGRLVNKVELAEILGVSERTLTTWQEEPAFPFDRGELRGQENVYDTSLVVRWWIGRELGKASPAEEERRRLLTAQAHLKELELARARGQVVDAEGISREIWRGYRETRDHLLDIAPRVAPMLANERDPIVVQHLLDKEIRRTLTALVALNKARAEAVAAGGDDTQPVEVADGKRI